MSAAIGGFIFGSFFGAMLGMTAMCVLVIGDKDE